MPTRTATIIFRVDSAGYLRELDKVERKTREAANATTSLEKSSARANRQSATLTKQHRQQAREAGVLSSALRGAGAALGVFVAIDLLRRLGRMALEFTRIAARIMTVRLAFETLTRQKGIDPATFFREIQQAAGGALGAIDSYLIGNRALLANNEELVRRLPEVVKATRAVAAATGIEYVQAIRDLTTGIIKLEPEILDNLGLNVKLEQTNKQAAAALGIATSALTFQQKEAAFTAEAIRQLTERAAKLGDIQNPQVTETGKLAAAYENLSAKIGNLVQTRVVAFLQNTTHVANNLADAIERITPERRAVGPLLAIASGTTLQEAEGQRADIERRARRAAHRRIAAQRTLARIDPGQAFFSERLARERDLAERTADIERAKLIVLGKQLVVINKYIAVKEQELRVVEATEAATAAQARSAAAAARVSQLAGLSIAGVTPGSRGGQFGPVGINTGAIGERGPEDTFFQDRGDALSNELSNELRREAAAATRQANQELLLFISSLESLHPTLGGLARTAINVQSSIGLLSNPSTGLLGQFAAGFGIAGAAISVGLPLLTGLADALDIGKSAADRMREAEERLAQQREQNAERLTGAFNEALETVRFNELVAGYQFSIAGFLSQAFQGIEGRQIQQLTGLPAGTQELEGLSANFIIQALQSAYGRADEEVQPLIRNITREVIQRQRSIAQAEIDVRREQAQIIIKEIERQRREVLDHIRNAEEAQRQATTRAVSLTFDLLEADLRTQYTRQFVQAGSSPSAREATRENLFRDIETLRGGESQTLTRELDNISQTFNQQRDEAGAYFDALQSGVELAINDLSLDFDTALQTHVTAELMKLNEAQPTFLEALNQIAPNFATQWVDTIQPGIDEFMKMTIAEPIVDIITRLKSSVDLDSLGIQFGIFNLDKTVLDGNTAIVTAINNMTTPAPVVTINPGATYVTVSVDQAGNATEGTTKDDDVITGNPTPTESPTPPVRTFKPPAPQPPGRTFKPPVPQPKPFNPEIS